MRTILTDRVAIHESRGEIDEPLFSEESGATANYSLARLTEFTTGRACARRAMAELGRAPVAIPKGDSGEPLWPGGVIGSITHCPGYRAAAVAMKSEFWTIGIDAEPHEPLPEGVSSMVMSTRERAHLDKLASRWPHTHWDRIVFCVKEAVYKAWFQVEHVWLDFDQVEVAFYHQNRFRATLWHPWSLGNAKLYSVEGSWIVSDSLVRAALTLSKRGH